MQNSMSIPNSMPMPHPIPMPNSMRGEFVADLAGRSHRFDTNLGTIACIEDACGDTSIVEILDRCIARRRAATLESLIVAALTAHGHATEAAKSLAARTASVEAEAFVLALMRALGFSIVPRTEQTAETTGKSGEASGPLDGAAAGAAGANSPSAP